MDPMLLRWIWKLFLRSIYREVIFSVNTDVTLTRPQVLHIFLVIGVSWFLWMIYQAGPRVIQRKHLVASIDEGIQYISPHLLLVDEGRHKKILLRLWSIRTLRKNWFHWKNSFVVRLELKLTRIQCITRSWIFSSILHLWNMQAYSLKLNIHKQVVQIKNIYWKCFKAVFNYCYRTRDSVHRHIWGISVKHF